MNHWNATVFMVDPPKRIAIEPLRVSCPVKLFVFGRSPNSDAVPRFRIYAKGDAARRLISLWATRNNVVAVEGRIDVTSTGVRLLCVNVCGMPRPNLAVDALALEESMRMRHHPTIKGILRRITKSVAADPDDETEESEGYIYE